MKTVSTNRAHGGTQGVYRHASTATGTDMTFAVFVPDKAKDRKLPVLWYLSGLTCTHANVMEKGEYRRLASELGLIIICPDTSPRGEDVPDDEAYDMGQGAGFYVDATEKPWSEHFQMRTCILQELPPLISQQFPANMTKQGIFGHSMGGHGALTLGLRNPNRFSSVSAFAPICAPSQVPWGKKAFSAYLGDNRSSWESQDAVALIKSGSRLPEILVDQGTADEFMDEQLRPDLLQNACDEAGIDLTLRMQEGYDHSYYFISTFMEDHLRWHAERL